MAGSRSLNDMSGIRIGSMTDSDKRPLLSGMRASDDPSLNAGFGAHKGSINATTDIMRKSSWVDSTFILLGCIMVLLATTHNLLTWPPIHPSYIYLPTRLPVCSHSSVIPLSCTMVFPSNHHALLTCPPAQ